MRWRWKHAQCVVREVKKVITVEWRKTNRDLAMYANQREMIAFKQLVEIEKRQQSCVGTDLNRHLLTWAKCEKLPNNVYSVVLCTNLQFEVYKSYNDNENWTNRSKIEEAQN